MPSPSTNPGARPPLVVRLLSSRNILTVVALLCFLVGAAHAVRGMYRKWLEDHLVKQARGFYGQGDFRSAALCARQALLGNPAQAEACRIMAMVATRAGAPEALFWWGRVTELNPRDPSAPIEWATVAMQQGDLAAADHALQLVKGDERKTIRYHLLAAGMAVMMKLPAVAEMHFIEAVKQNPSDHGLQLNVAVMQLGSSDSSKAAMARRVLDRLRLVPGCRVTALRSLMADSLRRSDLKVALRYAKELKAAPEAGFQDHVLHMGVLFRQKHSGFAPELAALQKRAEARPTDVSEMMAWMNGNGLSKESMAWWGTLPDPIRLQPVVRMAMAESCVLTRDWRMLQDLTAEGPWGGFELARLAYRSRALNALGDAAASGLAWKQAVDASGGQTAPVAMLIRLADAWGWSPEAEELLWLQAHGSGNPRWALISLYQRCRQRGDTTGLQRVVTRIVELDPSDLVARNNLATFAMLLGNGLPSAWKQALSLHESNPSNVVFRTTHALALHTQGRDDEALRVMETLTPGQLRDPAISAYYGIILSAAGQWDKAARHLDLARNAPLLPEEVELVNQARRRLRSREGTRAPPSPKPSSRSAP